MFWRRSGSQRIGLIAGHGDLPVLFARAASDSGTPLDVFMIRGITDPRIRPLAQRTHEVELGSLETFLGTLKASGVRRIVLAGGIPKRELYNPSFRLDQTAKDLIQARQNRGDDHLLKALSVLLRVRCGARVIDSRGILKQALVRKGVLTRRPPEKQEWQDLKFGYNIAKGIGRLDIGQTVVVRQGVVLAVEAIEGTDQTILRGGELCRQEAVVVKVSKPNQDLRFDLPCIGPETLEILKRARSRVLGVEAGKTLVLGREEVLARADREGFTIVGL